MEFRVLIVDDEPQVANDVEELIMGNKVLSAPYSISCHKCNSFEEAKEILTKEAFNLVILDLKDDKTQKDADPAVTELAGETLASRLKEIRFTPIVFYSGFAAKISEHQRPYVRMVTKGDAATLRAEVQAIFDTKIPHLLKHLEGQLKDYMWDSVEKLWLSGMSQTGPYEFVYLIARRISNLLQSDVLREFLTSHGSTPPAEQNIHPVELYIWPPVSKKSFFFGDILKRSVSGTDTYFVILSPSCDLQQSKADFILLGQCTPLEAHPDCQKVMGAITTNTEISATAAKDFTALLKDNARPTDRFKYLPGTMFLPDLVLDLQFLSSIPLPEIMKEGSPYEKVASLDTPFAESLQSKFTRYFGRIGTPDLSSDIAYAQFVKKMKRT